MTLIRYWTKWDQQCRYLTCYSSTHADEMVQYYISHGQQAELCARAQTGTTYNALTP